jgi:hypothetical protein
MSIFPWKIAKATFKHFWKKIHFPFYEYQSRDFFEASIEGMMQKWNHTNFEKN